MDSIVVVGGGGHAKVIISILKRLNNYRIYGYVDKVNRGKILDIPYIGDDNVLENLYKNENVRNAVIAIGQIKDYSLRHKVYNKVKTTGFSFPIIVSPNAIINESVSIEEGTVVMDGVVINSGTKVGKFSILNTNSAVDHDCEICDFVHIAPGVTLSGGVKVGNSSFIGAGATIIQYKSIGEKCIIGAGSVVTKDIKESGVYVGIPARPLS